MMKITGGCHCGKIRFEAQIWARSAMPWLHDLQGGVPSLPQQG